MVTTALAEQPQTPKLIAALQRAQDRIHELERENNALRTEMRWIDRLLAVPAQVMSPSQKVTLRAAVKAYRHGTPDEKGFVQIESWKLCKTVGQSKDTFLDNLALCWPLGTSVLAFDVLFLIERAFLSKHTTGTYNQYGSFCPRDAQRVASHLLTKETALEI